MNDRTWRQLRTIERRHRVRDLLVQALGIVAMWLAIVLFAIYVFVLRSGGPH